MAGLAFTAKRRIYHGHAYQSIPIPKIPEAYGVFVKECRGNK